MFWGIRRTVRVPRLSIDVTRESVSNHYVMSVKDEELRNTT